MTHLLAQQYIGNLECVGNICNTVGVGIGLKFTQVVSSIIGLLTVVGALWFIFQLFIGAFGWISAGSDKQALDNAKKRITNALIGLLVITASFTLAAVVGAIFGIDLINLDALIQTIKIH